MFCRAEDRPYLLTDAMMNVCLFPGDSQPLDVCSVHHHSTLVRYSVSLVGYGFYGDVLAESERHRWMGPLRYDYSGNFIMYLMPVCCYYCLLYYRLVGMYTLVCYSCFDEYNVF